MMQMMPASNDTAEDKKVCSPNKTSLWSSSDKLFT